MFNFGVSIMNNIVVIGGQFGDEGKGRIVDHLSKDVDYVVRWQGGANAGHTIYKDGEKYKTHLLPSGVLRDNVINIIDRGVAIDPAQLVKEIREFGIKPNRLFIDENCPIVLTWHKKLDKFRESKKDAIGTTQKGIGPCYEDWISRRGILLKDIFDPHILQTKLESLAREKLHLLNSYSRKVRHHSYGRLSIANEYIPLRNLAAVLKPYVKDVFPILEEAHYGPEKVLYEGAQSVLLDIAYGDYPNVTSSFTGAKFGLLRPVSGNDRVIGVIKPYETRVGTGPLDPMTEDQQAWFREKGQEFGTTTGRPRKIGHLSIDNLVQAKQIGGITEWAINKLDIALDFYNPEAIEMWLDRIEIDTGIPITFTGFGPNREDLSEICE
jgi:adenylosuccinate synthase